jgi:sigma-B regulation protein RsbU (phosphoserine phosphatase)
MLAEYFNDLDIGIVVFDFNTLEQLSCSSKFNAWATPEGGNLAEILPDLDLDKVKKRLGKNRTYEYEVQILDGNRNRMLKYTFKAIKNGDQILAQVVDYTKEKELEYMIDSYAKLSEKNKKQLERALNKIESQNNRMLQELAIARQVQMGMLPFDFNPDNDTVEFAALLKPAKEVGGDFFDIFYIDSDNLCVCLGDVSDKGAGSALFMAATKTLIKSHALNSKSTASIVSRINNELTRNNERCMFTTLFVGIFNIEKGTLLFSNCGHCYPFLVNENMSLSEVKELNGPAVGVLKDFLYSEQEILITPNQTLLVYSDGVTEAGNKAGEFYTDKTLKTLIKSSKTYGNPENLIHTIFDSVDEFEKGTEQSDDITILALKYKPN